MQDLHWTDLGVGGRLMMYVMLRPLHVLVLDPSYWVVVVVRLGVEVAYVSGLLEIGIVMLLRSGGGLVVVGWVRSTFVVWYSLLVGSFGGACLLGPSLR